MKSSFFALFSSLFSVSYCRARGFFFFFFFFTLSWFLSPSLFLHHLRFSILQPFPILSTSPSPSADPPHSLLLHSPFIRLPPPSPSLPHSSCSPTITQTEASVSAVFLAGLEDPPHNQTGAKLILPPPDPDWTSAGQANPEHYISYVWTNWFTWPAPLVCNGQPKSTKCTKE